MCTTWMSPQCVSLPTDSVCLAHITQAVPWFVNYAGLGRKGSIGPSHSCIYQKVGQINIIWEFFYYSKGMLKNMLFFTKICKFRACSLVSLFF